ELYSVPLAEPDHAAKLNGPLLRGPSESDVQGFRIAAGGQRVVYRIARQGSFDGHLLSVCTSGKPRLEELGPPGMNVFEFELDPAGQRAFFIGDGVFSTSVDGQGDARRLDDLPQNGVAFELRVTPDGGRVVFEYVLQDDVNPRVGLASVASDGSAT